MMPTSQTSRSGIAARLPLVRAFGCLLALSSLAACAGGAGTHLAAVQEAQRYEAHAARDYTPPGPPEDPWGPYIVEAGRKFDVPDQWIRAVMHQESGGRLYSGSGLTTSPVGAMGLMQVMPETYDMLRARYGLGDDPYDPHNNIMAGTAYVREMYDLYGSPGFLAAYNAGPGRLDDYLTRNRALPEETRRYVAAIGPHIADSFPVNRSPAEQYAMTAMPLDVPAGPRYARVPDTSYASADPAPVYAPRVPLPPSAPAPFRNAPMLVAQLPEPPRPAEPPMQMAQNSYSGFVPPQHPAGGLHLIQPAMADTLQLHRGGANTGGGWAIQVGAYGNEGLAHAAASAARDTAGSSLAGARTAVGMVREAHGTLYRARLTGLSREAATQACEHLGRHGGCMVISPESQS